MTDVTATSRVRRFLTEAHHLPKMLRLVKDAAGRWTVVWALLLVVQGVLPAVLLYLTRAVVDGFAVALEARTGWSGATPLVMPLALIGLVAIAVLLVRMATGWVQELQAELLQDHTSGLIHEKSANVRMAFYDFPEFHDHLHRARAEAGYRPAWLLASLGGLFQSGVTLAGVGAVLVTAGRWLLPAVLLMSTAPLLWAVVRNSLRHREWQTRVTSLERRVWYYDVMLTARETAAEMRAYQLAAPFSGAYQALRGRLRREQLDLVRRDSVTELGALLLGLAVAAMAALWVISQALGGLITVGTLAMVYAAFVQGQSAMRGALEGAGQLLANSLFLAHLFAFLALETEPQQRSVSADPTTRVSTPLRLSRGIRFEAVDFTYPGSTRPALTGFDLDVPANKVVAIVGPNGAGKSTVFKLLCRFYEPNAGRILIDGLDIASQTPAETRHTLSVLFQDPVRYSETVRESVALGDDDPSPVRVRAAVHAAGADRIVEHLPGGYDTLLGKEFETGTELSGGEWQRIALARALMRPAPILLLDEPTSAMDSWAELEWFGRLREATSGRTTIIITHRFTTARRADVIHVMDAGKIVESGTHDQLVAAGGSYAESWDRQTGQTPHEPATLTA